MFRDASACCCIYISSGVDLPSPIGDRRMVRKSSTEPGAVGSPPPSRRIAPMLAIASAAAIVGVVFWGIGKNEQAAADAATRFAAALVENDPDAAPKGSPEYIRGMRAYFGPVTGARVLDTHNERA